MREMKKKKKNFFSSSLRLLSLTCVGVVPSRESVFSSVRRRPLVRVDVFWLGQVHLSLVDDPFREPRELGDRRDVGQLRLRGALHLRELGARHGPFEHVPRVVLRVVKAREERRAGRGAHAGVGVGPLERDAVLLEPRDAGQVVLFPLLRVGHVEER